MKEYKLTFTEQEVQIIDFILQNQTLLNWKSINPLIVNFINQVRSQQVNKKLKSKAVVEKTEEKKE